MGIREPANRYAEHSRTPLSAIPQVEPHVPSGPSSWRARASSSIPSSLSGSVGMDESLPENLV